MKTTPSSFASTLLSVLAFPVLPAAASLWSVPITFQEYTGNAGGFPAGNAEWANQNNPSPATRSFDVVKPAGTEPDSGKPIYAAGQDGKADLSITARVMDTTGGAWASMYASKTMNGLQAGTLVQQDTSRPGSFGLVSFEIRFDPSLELSASDFAMRLVSANGTSALYEWTMVTIGTADQAPFTTASLANYSGVNYSNLASGSYYNADGSPTGNAGTGTRLASGQSISQYLSGSGAAPVSGGLVKPGWYSIDDFNASVLDGPEDFLDNPFPGDGSIDDNQTLTGKSLGLADDASFDAITVWFGYHDVAFDSDGDGYTATSSNIYQRLSGLTLGSYNPSTQVPEAGSVLLSAAAALILSARRARK